MIEASMNSLSDTTTYCRWPHLAGGRVVQPGQRIHASVAFASESYYPKAQFSKGMADIKWSDIVGKGDITDSGWISKFEHLLELDLFDLSATKDIIKKLHENPDQEDLFERLNFIALTGK